MGLKCWYCFICIEHEADLKSISTECCPSCPSIPVIYSITPAGRNIKTNKLTAHRQKNPILTVRWGEAWRWQPPLLYKVLWMMQPLDRILGKYSVFPSRLIIWILIVYRLLYIFDILFHFVSFCSTFVLVYPMFSAPLEILLLAPAGLLLFLSLSRWWAMQE